jgi:hypothetical protein
MSALVAGASHHHMAIQEVFPGTPADPEAQYVMLRVTRPRQDDVYGLYVRVEDAGGRPLGAFGAFYQGRRNGGSGNCAYPECPALLIGTDEAEALLGISFDQLADDVPGYVHFPLGGGRICVTLYDDVFDCVAYGDYRGADRIAEPTPNGWDGDLGAPAPALVPGYSLTRTRFDCAGRDNASDFALLFPRPENNRGDVASGDEDGDSLLDALDCDDADPALWYPPAEISGLRIAPGESTLLTWDGQEIFAGTAVLYDVVSGHEEIFRSTGDHQGTGCAAWGMAAPSALDTGPELPAGKLRYFLARARNACGTGAFGDAAGTPDPRDLLDDPVNGPCR